MAVKKVNLSNLLKEVTNLGTDVLGEAEYKILIDAMLLLKSNFPVTDSDRASYITKSSSIQSDLINLGTRIDYLSAMKNIEKLSNFAELASSIDAKNKEDRQAQAIMLDTQYRDLSEIMSTLDVVSKMISNLNWSLKTVLQRVKEN